LAVVDHFKIVSTNSLRIAAQYETRRGSDERKRENLPLFLLWLLSLRCTATGRKSNERSLKSSPMKSWEVMA